MSIFSLAERYVKYHHYQKARHSAESSRMRAFQLRFGDKLFHHHIQHSARRKAQQPGQKLHRSARHEYRDNAEYRLYQARERAAEKCLFAAHARLRQRQREEAKAAKELAEARKKLEKEQSHYQNALSRLNAQIAQASGDDLAALEDKRTELETQLSTIEQELSDVDYRVANQRAGYVYIISNIGSFGEDVYKIGMTRRLEPMDRIDELGDASVPFNFDVHALIFTDDAPGLEASLHQAFADRKLNIINTRREFFHVTLDEIKEVVRQNYDKTVEFIDVPPAEQYRESLKMR